MNKFHEGIFFNKFKEFIRIQKHAGKVRKYFHPETFSRPRFVTIMCLIRFSRIQCPALRTRYKLMGQTLILRHKYHLARTQLRWGHRLGNSSLLNSQNTIHEIVVPTPCHSLHSMLNIEKFVEVQMSLRTLRVFITSAHPQI